jgi:hypothetical protein
MAAKRKKKTNDQRIITNMGLFWGRDKVRWKGNAGIGPARVAGVRAVAKKSGEVDFWNQTGIYSLYDANYRLVYVGQAGLSDISCIGTRLKQHIKDDLAGRWEMFSWFGLQRVNKTTNALPKKRSKINISTRGQLANVLEGIIIEVAEPPMNNRSGRFGRRVERYLQFDDSVDRDAKAHEKTLALISDLDEKVDDTRRRLTKHTQQATARLDKKVTKARRQLSKAIKKISK